uniref:Uncharacterized protein n=1 Tax=Glossina palpalis gambiensis TaxID=67801 RepID=A0A1B0B390_9MUSC
MGEQYDNSKDGLLTGHAKLKANCIGFVKPLFWKFCVSVRLTEFSPNMGVTTSPHSSFCNKTINLSLWYLTKMLQNCNNRQSKRDTNQTTTPHHTTPHQHQHQHQHDRRRHDHCHPNSISSQFKQLSKHR